jgi:hypothetical protein
MKMADDSNARYRSSDPHARAAAASASHGNDPLAELARLIGQTDPFSQASRNVRTPAQPGAKPIAPVRAQSAQPAEQSSVQPVRQRAYDPFAQPVHQAPLPGDHQYNPQTFTDTRIAYASGAYSAAGASPQPDAFAEQHAPEMRGAPHLPESPMLPADDFYSAGMQGGHRKGMVTVMAVLGLAVVGTLAAFGYRSLSGPSSSSAPPPVIRASAEPSKVPPPPSANPDTGSTKLTYDRFGDRGQNEQVVSREEQPVEMKDLARSAPRVVLPGAPTVNPTSSSVASAQVPGNPPSVLTEPKRVRTVPIRPDQPEAGVRPQTVPAAPIAPQRQAAAGANMPLDIAAQTASAGAPTVRTAPVRPGQNTSPLSLNPDSNPAQAQAARQAPTRLASVQSGGYVVQVASQRSEADAQSSYRSIQSKFSSLLSEHQAMIKRADLGDKGTYYRAMVGPFSTREQAIQLCGSLKAAGGDCVVQSN